MSGNKEELEFISVGNDDESEMLNHHNSISNNYYDGSTGGASDNIIGGWLFKQSKHPVAALFHILFKALSIFFYMFGSWFTSNFIFTFVLVIILLAADFWTVKNVSGRLLVGLRWWSYVKDDGSNEWVFESLGTSSGSEISGLDSQIFWSTLYITPLIWIFFLIIGILKLNLEYLPVIISAICMNSANIIGYMKCSSDQKNKMNRMLEQGSSFAGSTFSAFENSAVRNFVMNSLFAVASSDPKKSQTNV